MNILCMMRGENNLKVYYLALSLFLTFFFAHQITHVMCFGRYRDKKCKKKKFYFIYGFWVVFFGILCTMMGSASGIWTGIITISVIVIQLYELLCNSQDYDIAKFWILELRQKKYFQHIYSFYVSPHLWSVRIFII